MRAEMDRGSAGFIATIARRLAAASNARRLAHEVHVTHRFLKSPHCRKVKNLNKQKGEGQMTLKIGDVVMLKSGGARMVVAETGYNDGQVKCVWHNDVGAGWEHREQVYHPDALKEVPN